MDRKDKRRPGKKAENPALRAAQTADVANAQEVLDSYHKSIKQKLYDWMVELETACNMKLDFKRLADRMMEYGIETTDQKLRMMFNTAEPRKIQLAEMMALCEILHLSVYEFCALPALPETESDLLQEPAPWFRKTGDTPKASGISSLNAPHYYGDYHCYFFKPKHMSAMALGGKKGAEGLPLKEAKLQLREEGGVCFATLTDGDGFTMRGRVFLIERSRQVCTRLLDREGMRMINLLFSYRDYSVTPLMYRTAGMLTVSYNDREAPLFQKMAMFRVKQDLGDSTTESLVRGILTLDSQNILVEKERFDALLREDEAFGGLNPPVRNYCVFRESDFSGTDLPWSYGERVLRLLKLRQISELSSHEIVDDSEDLAKFLMTMQFQDPGDLPLAQISSAHAEEVREKARQLRWQEQCEEDEKTADE